MEQCIKDKVGAIKIETISAKTVILQNTDRTVKISTPDETAANLRVFIYNGVLTIKYYTTKNSDITIKIPSVIQDIRINSEKGSLMMESIETERFNLKSTSETVLNKVTVKSGCSINHENSKLKMAECDISSMNIQICSGSLMFSDTQLHGNSTAFFINGKIGGTLKGALIDYVISAGSGIDPEKVVVNDHRLSEFPNRKNVQNCAWLLLAGSLAEDPEMRICRPKTYYY